MSTKWCRFANSGGNSFGRIEGDEVVAYDAPPWDGGKETARRYSIASVKLLPPVIPRTFYAVGLNYKDHILATARRTNAAPRFPERPDVGFRSSSALIADGDPIIKPCDAGDLLEYEGELVVVIGRKGRRIARENALEHVFGWTIGNDVSERGWQRADRTNWRAKNTDSFKPMGPWIVTDANYRDFTTVVRLNGEEVDRFATGDMINDVETYIVEISKYCTLFPGDVIWMGTDGEPRRMNHGDICEIEISGIGSITNQVLREQ